MRDRRRERLAGVQRRRGRGRQKAVPVSRGAEVAGKGEGEGEGGETRYVKECAARVPERHEVSAHHRHKWQTKCMARGRQRVSLLLVFKCWDMSVRDQKWATSPAKNAQRFLLCSSPQFQGCAAASMTSIRSSTYRSTVHGVLLCVQHLSVRSHSALHQMSVDTVCYTQSLSPPPCFCSLPIAPPSILLSQHPQPPAPALLLCTGTALPRKAPTGSCSSGQGDSGA